jgi:Domain of unknown function (DUF397)
MTTHDTPRGRAWRTSSYSDSARQCIEAGQAGTGSPTRAATGKTCS